MIAGRSGLEPAELLELVEEFKAALVNRATGGSSVDFSTYGAYRRTLQADPTTRALLPEFVQKCRTPDEFWTHIKEASPTYQGRREILAAQFDRLLTELEHAIQRNATLVELDAQLVARDALSQEFLEQQVRKCNLKLADADFDGAITNARSLLEGIFVEVERRLAEGDPPTDGDLVRQYGRVQRLLNLHPGEKDLADTLRQILSGMSSVVTGLAGLRNKLSDGHARRYKPERHHARLAVNAAKTIATFTLESYDHQLAAGRITPQSKPVGVP